LGGNLGKKVTYHDPCDLGKLGGNLGKKVTYHDPCDLGRAFQIFDEPREILKALTLISLR